ncbi:hypothetical protein GIB67_035103 [Kingdonia uniflora]|uniref:Paladin n=1 Tax=Kingdonia uniflora TaxID=39325 RepID=A0A7J7NCT3_9MAGN|nr:hypothetical protein GIB67_035103 [Kingdonia uniflora]
MTTIPKEPAQVMKQRVGSVLGKQTILKSDHFPGCQNKRLTPQIDGAPNYRQADSLRVHGVAIPTTEGIRNVLDYIGAQKNGKKTKVLWHNLREEPVVYINGRPFVLRDVERPFSNLEYTGINRERVEQMEARLKEDILQEAARYGNKILVTDELPDGQMVDQWEPVTNDFVKTPLEVYEELQVEGYRVDYERVPITDEKSPKEQDFDLLVYRISQAGMNTEVIFNCQMGRGRTTTGMVVATLVYLNRIGASAFQGCYSKFYKKKGVKKIGVGEIFPQNFNWYEGHVSDRSTGSSMDNLAFKESSIGSLVPINDSLTSSSPPIDTADDVT